jgi:hypothetical protein
MKYLNLTNPSTQYAETISQAIWSARYPEEVRQGSETTNSYCGYIVHPISGHIALVFPDEIIPIHPMRKIQPLLDIVTAPLPDEMKSEVSSHLQDFDWENKPTTIDNLLPPLYAANLMTKEEAELQGWFNNGV